VTITTPDQRRRSQPVVSAGLRVVGAALVGTIGGIHGYLWAEAGYRHLPTVGWMFLALTIASGLATGALLVVPVRYGAIVAAGGAMLAAGTIGGLVISITVGLFGFKDSIHAPLAAASVWVEAAAVVVLALLAGLWVPQRAWPASRHGSAHAGTKSYDEGNGRDSGPGTT
jgi:hypothetical protein